MPISRFITCRPVVTVSVFSAFCQHMLRAKRRRPPRCQGCSTTCDTRTVKYIPSCLADTADLSLEEVESSCRPALSKASSTWLESAAMLLPADTPNSSCSRCPAAHDGELLPLPRAQDRQPSVGVPRVPNGRNTNGAHQKIVPVDAGGGERVIQGGRARVIQQVPLSHQEIGGRTER